MFEESEQMQKNALNAYVKVLGEESSAVALVLNQLGRTYSTTKQFHKSRFANLTYHCSCICYFHR